MSVRPSVRPSIRLSVLCQHFKNLKTRDRWADVHETNHVYSMGLWTQLLGSRILNFGPCTARGHPELSRVGIVSGSFLLHNPSWTTKMANSISSISNEFNFTSKTQFEQNRLQEKRTVNRKTTSTTPRTTDFPVSSPRPATA